MLNYGSELALFSLSGAFVFLSTFTPRYALPMSISCVMMGVSTFISGFYLATLVNIICAVGCIVWPLSMGLWLEMVQDYPRFKRMVSRA